MTRVIIMKQEKTTTFSDVLYTILRDINYIGTSRSTKVFLARNVILFLSAYALWLILQTITGSTAPIIATTDVFIGKGKLWILERRSPVNISDVVVFYTRKHFLYQTRVKNITLTHDEELAYYTYKDFEIMGDQYFGATYLFPNAEKFLREKNIVGKYYCQIPFPAGVIPLIPVIYNPFMLGWIFYFGYTKNIGVVKFMVGVVLVILSVFTELSV